MKSIVALLVAGLSAGTALPGDHATPRNGGAAPAGGGHHGGATASSAGGRSTSHGGSSGGAVARSDRTDAERRHPRPGTGTGRFRGGRSYGYPGYYGYRYGYSGYYPYGYRSAFFPRSYFYFGYDPFWYDDYAFYGYGYGYGRHPRGYYSYEDRRGAVRLQVQPEKARVYVDGYYAGIVDDFNGLFQRLYLSPGRHDVTLKAEGFRSHTFKLYAPSGQTVKLHFELAKGAGEDPVDEVSGRPVAYERMRDDDLRRGDEGDDRDEGVRRREESKDPGRVRFDFRPDDATIYVDGEFRGNARTVQTIEIAPGVHRVEAVRPGYRTFEREIDVQSGDNPPVKVDLERK